MRRGQGYCLWKTRRSWHHVSQRNTNREPWSQSWQPVLCTLDLLKSQEFVIWFLNLGRDLGLGTVASMSEEPGWACPIICSDITSSRMFSRGTQFINSTWPPGSLRGKN